MRYQGSDIPHFETDDKIRGFFETFLGVEFIDDIDKVRPSVVRRDKRKGEVARDTPFARNLREALEYLLGRRPVTAEQWGQLTHVFFYEEDALYAYLQDLYDYFYGDRKEPPVAPDPEAPPPEKYWS
ncbi:hypothetical protein [Streptomyces gilvosporeus]|uniref:Uncharacterized protein n=1 Tax=Streptomyces gilvosporeus TaxID=553510 RepID=A0A1V0TTM6_9ACTN|nr:hypothetical protein [Streptomyces gilvosporeus]ARF56200.1 hypothetical protein B1H19_20240 [Streptomyces gilvosporeus]